MSDPTSVDAANDVMDLDHEPHNREDVDLLYRIYLDKRIASNAAFYESRIKENQLNADFTFTAGALVMTLSSLIATISASAGAPSYLSLLSAILPAFAALLGAFRQLYGWERQTNIYRDSLLGLERVKLIAPDDDRVAISDLMKIYPELVSSSETVFTGEVNQWGQFILDKEKGSDTSDAKAMDLLVGNLDLSDEQRAIITAVLSSGKGAPESKNLLSPVNTTTSTSLTSTTSTTSQTEEGQQAVATSVVEINASHNVETAPPDAETAGAIPAEAETVKPTKPAGGKAKG